MANTIGAKIVLEGEKEYRNAIKEINSEQKELRSELKLASAEFSGQANSVEALTKKQDILTQQYETQRKKVDIYSDALDNARDKQKKATEKVDSLKEALVKAEKEFEEMKDSTDTASGALDNQKELIDELKKKLSLAQEEYGKTKTSTNEWQTSLNNAKTTLTEMDSILKENGKKLEEAENVTNDTTKSVGDYSNAVEEASKKTDIFGDVLKANLTADAIKKGLQELIDGLKAVTSVGAGFESAMSTVAATMGMTGEEIEQGSKEYQLLKETAEECGKTTKYTAEQSADALNYLALAGYDATKAAETLPKVLNLAAAGGMELATASDLVTDSMAALGMETDALDNYIDQMAKTSQKSNTNVQQLGEASLVCAGTVSMAQQSVMTMNAELGILANNGIKGAEGGTHLRNVLNSLITPTDKGAGALEELGVKVYDSTGKVRDMNDILSDLNESTAKLSSEEKNRKLSNIFNTTDISAVNALLKGTGDEFKNLVQELENCDGAAADMAQTMQDNLEGKVTTLQSALEGLATTAYEKVEGVLKDSVDSATDAVGKLDAAMANGKLGDSIDDLGDALHDAADDLLEFGEDALPIVIDGLSWLLEHSDEVITGLVTLKTTTSVYATVTPLIQSVTEAWELHKTAQEGAKTAQLLLNGAMSANPIGAVVALVAAATAAMVTYKKVLGNGKDETEEFAKTVSEATEKIQKSTEARKASQEEEAAELKIIRDLKDELLELNERENLSNEEKSRMLMLVTQLNEAMPDLNLELDEQNGHLKDGNDELEDYITNMQKSLEIGFMQEDLTEIAKEHYEAQKNLNQITDEYNKLQDEATQIQNGWTKACEEGETAMREFNENIGSQASDALADINEKLEKLTPSLEDAKEAEEKLQQEYDEMCEKLESVTGKTEDATGAISEQETVLVNYKGKVHEVSPEIAESIAGIEQAYADAYVEAAKSIESQVSLFEKLNTASDLTLQEMSGNLKTQTETFNTYKDDLLRASDLVEEGLLEEGLLGSIKSLGIDGAGYLHELVEAAENDIESFNAIMEEWTLMTQAKEQLTETLGDINTGYSDSMDELLGVQEEKNKQVSDNTEELLKDTQENLEEAFKTQLKTTKESLSDMTQAVEEECPEINQASQKLCSASVEGANEILQIDDTGHSLTFVSIGYSIPEGIALGIEENSTKIKNALQGAIDNAIDSIDLSGITSKINRELGGQF